MDALLGFVVLSGPLFLIVILVPLFIYISVKLSKKFQGTKKRLIGGFAIFILLLFILFGDEIVGEMYLEYLCENKTEYVIHNQIKLPAKYWNENGSLKFPLLKNGMVNFKGFRNLYEVDYIIEPHVKSFISINKWEIIYFDLKTKQKAATKISFSRKHGWLSEFSPGPNGGESCGNVLRRKYGKTKYREMKNHQSQKFMNELFTINDENNT